MELVSYFIEKACDIVANGGIFFGFFLVFIESFIPALPLSVFVALNVHTFGFFIGVLMSWIATSLGSFICYLFNLQYVSKLLKKNKLEKLKKGVEMFRKISLSQLVLIITLPFTPSFLVNILAGVAKIPREKFIISLLIGKIFSIIFWGYIGKSLIESLTDIKSLIYIGIALVISYIISKIVSRRMNIE